jgi:shikimate dehydrogenase
LDQYAVMGNPVEHSKSPAIHAAFSTQTNQVLEYTARLVETGMFDEAVQSFFEGGGKGLNITVPYKQDAWQLANILSKEASMAGAVNTLFLDEAGKLNGHNTDGIGLVRDIIQNHGGTLEGSSILILGAGGASRGILLPILQQNPDSICIANRTVEKAQELAKEFSALGQVRSCGFQDLNGKSFDWIINATSASLSGQLPPLPNGILNSGAWCYDLMYSTQQTIFCHWASQAGAEACLDGLGMLVEQAAESFYLWRGVRPKTKDLLKSLRRA